MADADVPGAIEDMRGKIMKYYDLEKQIITDKYNTEIAAIKSKHSVELQNIQAIRDKLQQLTYSSFNLALPIKRWNPPSRIMQNCMRPRKTGDTQAVSKYLSFTDTYLKSGQDAYKSSSNIWTCRRSWQVSALDTNPAKTVAELTDRADKLIQKRTDAMNAELAKLGEDVTGALNQLGDGGYDHDIRDDGFDRMV